MKKIVFTPLALMALAACGAQDTAPSRQSEGSADIQASSAVNEAQTVQSLGIPISYKSYGAGDTAIVLVHGWSCDNTYWNAQIAAFSENHRVVAIDLGGHGASGTGREDFSIAAFTADVAAVVEAEDLENIVLVGHSMGGPVVVSAAALLGGRVAGVIGVDTLKTVGVQFPQEMIDEYLANLEGDFPGFTDGFVRTSFFVEGSDPDLIDMIAKDMASAPETVAINAMKGLIAYDAAAGLSAIADKPFVLINADYEPTNVAGLNAAHPTAQLIEMEGVGHFNMMEALEEFNVLALDAIASF